VLYFNKRMKKCDRILAGLIRLAWSELTLRWSQLLLWRSMSWSRSRVQAKVKPITYCDLGTILQ